MEGLKVQYSNTKINGSNVSSKRAMAWNEESVIPGADEIAGQV